MSDSAESSTKGDIRVERGMVGALTAEDVDVRFGAVGAVAARGGLFVHQGLCGPVAARGNVAIQQSFCGPIAALGDVSIRSGGCGPVIAAGDVSIENGGSQSVISLGGVKLGPRAFVGAILSPRVVVEEGSRILMSTRQALAFGGVFGSIVGLALLIRGRKDRS